MSSVKPSFFRLEPILRKANIEVGYLRRNVYTCNTDNDIVNKAYVLCFIVCVFENGDCLIGNCT